MPTYLKFVLSLLVAAVAATAFYFETDGAAGAIGGPAWAMLFLGAFMIGAVWLFPETKRRKDEGE